MPLDDQLKAEIDKERQNLMAGTPSEDTEEDEAEQEQAPEQEAEAEDEAEQEQQGEPEGEAQSEEEAAQSDDPDLEGFQTYEEYIANGGDPRYYRGPEAYRQQKQILKEHKETKKRFKQMEDFYIKELERKIEEAERAKEQAWEQYDREEYKQAEQRERELRDEQRNLKDSQGDEEASGDHPVVAEYRKEDPRLDRASIEYNPTYEAAFASALNTNAVQEAQRMGKQELDEDDLRRVIKKTEQDLGGPKKADPNAKRRQRPGKVAPPKQKATKEDPVKKLPDEARRMYNKWKERADKGDEKAQKYADNLLKQYAGGEQ